MVDTAEELLADDDDELATEFDTELDNELLLDLDELFSTELALLELTLDELAAELDPPPTLLYCSSQS